jgi:hypothetical protein
MGIEYHKTVKPSLLRKGFTLIVAFVPDYQATGIRSFPVVVTATGNMGITGTEVYAMHAIGKGFVGHDGKWIAIIRAVHDKLRYPARGNISRNNQYPDPGRIPIRPGRVRVMEPAGTPGSSLSRKIPAGFSQGIIIAFRDIPGDE